MTVLYALGGNRTARLATLPIVVAVLTVLFVTRSGRGGLPQADDRETTVPRDRRSSEDAQNGHVYATSADASAVGRSGLAGSTPLQDALNPSREAQRIASVNLGGVVYQALGYVSDPDRKVVVAVRNDRGSDQWTAWNVYVYDGTDGLPDLGTVGQGIHNWVSIGFDAAGYLHLTWDMHRDPLKYRRSSASVDGWNGALTARRSMRGTHEDSVTYVRFHLLGGTLYATFRDGSAGSGNWFFYEYDLQNRSWRAGPGLDSTEGMLLEGRPDDQNPYLFRDPALDDDGNIHFAWNWRTSAEVSTNHTIEYCMWNGSRYVTPAGAVLSVPLREGEAEQADPVGFDSGLADMEALAVDADGRPHLAYRKNGPDGFMQMFHVWHDGSAWRSTQLTSTEHPSYYTLTDDGGMYLSGAAIAPFTDGTVSILFTDAADDNHLARWMSSAPFGTWSKEIIYDEMDLGYYEAGLDRRTLRERGRLFVPIIPWDASDPDEGWPVFVLDALNGFPGSEPSEDVRVRLPGNYPNPVHDRSTIPYELTRGGAVRLALYNGMGQHVQTVVSAFREAGLHQVELNAQPLSSGVYVLRIEVEGHSATEKIVVVK